VSTARAVNVPATLHADPPVAWTKITIEDDDNVWHQREYESEAFRLSTLSTGALVIFFNGLASISRESDRTVPA
jgi:hypothetical protein